MTEPKNKKIKQESMVNDVEAVIKIERMESNKTKIKQEPEVNDIQAEIIDAVEKKKAAERLTAQQVKHLEKMVIELRHELPPQHKIEASCGTRTPTPDEFEAMIKILGVKNLKRGTFGIEEDQLIVRNWKAFCKQHKWNSKNPRPFLFHRHYYSYYLRKTVERKKFVQYLADGLPNRSLYSVYHRFRNLYDVHKVNKYSSEEDQYILEYMKNKKHANDSRAFANLGVFLNRSRASVWRRYRLLNKKRKMLEEDEDDEDDEDEEEDEDD